jgi:hypothetical protein
MTHRLVFGVSGQTLSYTPATRQGVSWVLEDLSVGEDDSARLLASGSISAPAAGTPTSQASGPSTPYKDRVFCPLSVSPGETLRITSATSGVSELVDVDAAVASQHFTAKHPLTTLYPRNSTVERLTVTTSAVPDAVVTDEDRLDCREPMRVVWTLDDGTRTQQQVWLVRHTDGDLDMPAVISTVKTLFHDLTTRMEHNGRSVVEDQVRLQAKGMRAIFNAKGIPFEGFLMGDAGTFALAFKTLRHFAALGNVPGNQTPEAWEAFLDDQIQTYLGDILVGQDGRETVELEPVEDSAKMSKTHRRVLQEL